MSAINSINQGQIQENINTFDVGTVVNELMAGNTAILDSIDLNSYVDYEGESTLVSSFLITFFLNPELNKQSVIFEVLDRKPNLNLPITEGSNMTCIQFFEDVLQQMPRIEFLIEEIENLPPEMLDGDDIEDLHLLKQILPTLIEIKNYIHNNHVSS